MSGAGEEAMLRIMPREMRMMTERIFSLTNLPKGFVPAAQDVVMISEKLGLGGFAHLEDRVESLKDADLSRIRIASEGDGELCLDGGGQHAWFVALTLVDLMGELVQRSGSARVTVVNTLYPAELQIAVALGSRSGLAVLFTGGEEAQLTASAITATGDLRKDEPLLWALLQDGAQIEPDLWWRIYRLAQKALTPDSVVSRRHAGPLIVNDDGTVIGRKDNDDETDISFLTSARSGVQKQGADT
ncbi:hypothetical protein [Chelativorans sp. YIM 93263]|uniref:hypothetical protein n=1 Tax=Chelativorans sp. YIM 93263 TaxID=2906648 RepID=UPI0023795F8F|nr:hypothetical protein [Chelativorans sp. YIM 93263]